MCQISKNTFLTEHLWATASTLRKGRRLKQIRISIISKFHKENNNKKKMFLHFLFFTCFAHPFFFSGFTFYKEAICFIIFRFSLCSNMLNLENILEYIRQKLKRHARFKISSWDEVFTCLFIFFFIPGWNFIPVFLTGMSSSGDEILSRQKRVNNKRHLIIDRDYFIPRWNFTCKHLLRVSKLA